MRTSHHIVGPGFMLDLQNSGTLDTSIICLVIAVETVVNNVMCHVCSLCYHEIIITIHTYKQN